MPGSIKQGELIREGDESRDELRLGVPTWRRLTAGDKMIGVLFDQFTMYPIRRLSRIA